MLQVLVDFVHPDMTLGWKGLSPSLPGAIFALYYTWGFRAQGTEEA